MKIRITKKGLPKAQQGLNYLKSNSFKQNMDKIQGTFNPNVPSLNTPGYSPKGLPSISEAIPKPSFSFDQQPGMDKILGTFKPNNDIFQSYKPMGLNPNFPIPEKKTSNNPSSSGLSDAMSIFNFGLTGANMLVDAIGNKRRQNEFNRSFRNSLLTPTATPPTSGSRGDYTVNEGFFRPDEMQPPNKGMFANPYYGQYDLGGGIETVREINTPDPIIDAPELDAFPLPEMSGEMSSYNVEVFSNTKEPAELSSPLKDLISQRESGGDYKALPKKKDGTLASSAAGKYQFLWNTHKKDIEKLTGIKTKQQFLDTPEAQEKYFEYWDKNTLTPAAKRIKSELGVSMPLNSIKMKVHFAGAQGAYDYFKTGKETVDAFGTTTSSYNANNMRVRITGGPQTKKMAYGGQMGYGLDLNNRKVYTDMPEQMTDMVSNSITEEDNPDDDYVLEAEGGETILRPDGTHFNITGKRHSEGGEKLTSEQAPEGSFIYSDTAKMKLSGPILKMFGKSGNKKYTPARLAKQYDINKYQAVLDDKYADLRAKSTAQLMKTNYEKKLGALALLQESKKNFKDGIPQVAMPYLESIMNAMPQQEQGEEELPTAKFGGYLRQYQGGNEVRRDFDLQGQKVNARKITQGDLNPQWKQVGKIGNDIIYKQEGASNTIRVPSGATFTPGVTVGRGQGNNPLRYTVEDMKQRPGLYKTVLGKEGWANASPQEQQAYLDRLKTTGQRSTFVPGAMQEKKVTLNPTYAFLEEDVPVEQSESQEQTSPVEKTVSQERGQPITPNSPSGMTGASGSERYGWTTPDKVNMINALMGRPKKYLPFIPELQFNLPQPTFEDWRAKAAARQAMYNTAAQTAGTYGPTQGLASNLSFMAGQQGDALIQDIAGTETRNVGIANQFAPVISDMMNKVNEYNVNRKKSLYEGNVIANQQYDNSLRQYRNNAAKAFGTGFKNASEMGALNSTNPYYYIDPTTGKLKFKNVNAYNAIRQMSGAGAADNSEDIATRYMNEAKRLKNEGFDAALIRQMLDRKFPKNAGASSVNNMAALAEQYRNLR